MANNTGTLVTSPVRPASDADTFPIAHASELLGGHHHAATLTARNAIPAERREEGMMCYVAEDRRTYFLEAGTANGNWRDIMMTDDRLIQIATSEGYEMLETTIDGDEIVSTATVRWPDGTPGVYTATVKNTTFKAVDAYTLTYAGTPARTITQAAMTRHTGNGIPTVKPPLTIA